jgi:hypothetical protein
MSTFDTLRTAGIPVPDFSHSWQDLSFPMLMRRDHRMAGGGIRIALQPKDIRDRDFFTEFIPKDSEFRVHVIGGKVAKVSKKVLREEADYDPLCWNYGNGFRFVTSSPPPGASLAMAALYEIGMDFGAVDLLIGIDGKPYVLEVNSAPACCRNTLEIYGSAIAEMVEIDPPGLDAVEFPE